MNSVRRAILLLCAAALLTSFVPHVHAGEPEGTPVIVRGLVVSSGHVLIINDGVQDYVLLGVDNRQFEGMICEATGTLHISDDELIIDVEEIRIVAQEYPEDDLVGERMPLEHPGPCMKQKADNVHQTSAGIAVFRLG